MPQLEIHELPIDELVEYENNAKLHPHEQVEQIANSISEFGFNSPVLAWHNDRGEPEIVAGHGRLMAAKKLGMEKLPVVFLDHMSEEQRRAYILVDNKLTMNSGFDDEILSMELSNIFDIDMSQFDFDIELDDEGDGEVEEDEVPEDAPSIVQKGDVWQLGRHRLMCGDSTDPAVIDRLMDGVKADMVFTDPPYNVAVGSKNKVLNKQDGGSRNETEIAGDKGLTDAEIGEQLWRPAFQNMADHAKDDCSIYVTMPQGGTHMMMMMMMADACWQVKHELMWLKNQPTFSIGRLDYDYKHEPIMYGWKKTHNFYGKGKFTKSVWEIDKPRESKLHPTMKPIELIANALENSTKENDCVLDVFGGSGSTLIACEQLNRKCYMCELDPHYCDIIIERWQNLTGETAQLVLKWE